VDEMSDDPGGGALNGRGKEMEGRTGKGKEGWFLTLGRRTEMKMPRRQGDDDNVATKVIAGHVPGVSDRLMLIYSAL
jgi:hypothetical protein